MVRSIKDLTYEELFAQYGRLIYKYCRFSIDGLSGEDIFQELSYVLFRCQQLFDPAHARGAKFSTYFVNAMKWKIGNLLHRATKRTDVWLSLDGVSAGDGDERPTRRGYEADSRAEAGLDEVILELDLERFSPTVQKKCRELMRRQKFRGLTFRVGDGELVREVREALAGYNDG